LINGFDVVVPEHRRFIGAASDKNGDAHLSAFSKDPRWLLRNDAGACRILAVDGSPETLAINRDRTNCPAIDYEIADIFSWSPTETFDIVFFSFWLSHVPRTRFRAFWDLVQRALRPHGKVLFLDSLLEQTSTATDHNSLDRSGIAHRRLNDGREF
jgi:SAM-dependent methyltransferase